MAYRGRLEKVARRGSEGAERCSPFNEKVSSLATNAGGGTLTHPTL